MEFYNLVIITEDYKKSLDCSTEARKEGELGVLQQSGIGRLQKSTIHIPSMSGTPLLISDLESLDLVWWTAVSGH